MIWRALDLETDLIAPGLQAPPPVSMAWADVQSPQSTTLRLWSDPRLLAELQALLQEGVIGHKIDFDMGVLVQYYPELRELVWQAYCDGRILDTLHACKLADVANDRVQKSYTLESCVQRELGEQVAGKHGPDSWRKRYTELREVPIEQWPPAAAEYARLDPTYTARLWNRVGYQPTLEFECRAAWALQLSSAWGMRCDGQEVAALEQTLEGVVGERNRALAQAGILRGDGSKDTKKIGALILAELGADTPRTPTKDVKQDADTLALCSHPVLVAMHEAASASTLKSTFLPIVQAGIRDGIVHPHYDVIKKTDRVSCLKPNLQNQPRKGGVRECFVPMAGNVFISVDYAGAELVCLAQVLLTLFGHSAMADAIRAGQDLHVKTGAMILGISYEDALARYKAGEPEVVEARQAAKGINFGAPGGMGVARLQAHVRKYGVEITQTQARDYKDRWLQLYPEMAKYFALLSSETRHGPTRIVHPLTGFVRGGCDYTNGANHFFQNLLAKIAKEALWLVSVECYAALGTHTALVGTRIPAFVHDEILLEARADCAAAAAERLAVVMRAAAKKWLPDLELGADPTLMTCWSKNAKALRDADGRLVAWSPN